MITCSWIRNSSNCSAREWRSIWFFRSRPAATTRQPQTRTRRALAVRADLPHSRGTHTQSKGIRAVSFDVGGTIIEPWPSVGHVYAEVAGRHGVSGVTPEELNRQFSMAWRKKSGFNYSQAAWFALVRQTFGARAAELPEAFFQALYQRFAAPDAWRIHDDVLPALDHLASAGLPLAIVSNWDERLHPLLDALKLRSYFDTVIVSCDVGFTKPAPVLFEMALRQLGLPAPAVLHVGDSLREDVEGARAAGLPAVLLRRGAAPAGGQIGSLRDLAQLL